MGKLRRLPVTLLPLGLGPGLLVGVYQQHVFHFCASITKSNGECGNRSLLFLFSPGDLGMQAFLSFSHFRGIRQSEVLHLEYLANLDFDASVEWSPLEPLNSFLQRRCLPQPVTRDEFLGFGKWSIDHCSLTFRKSHALALGTRVESVSREHHPRSYQLFVELPHFRKQFLGR